MATTMYLKFEDPAVAGSSKAPGHEGEIEVLSWSHGFNQSTSPSHSFPDSGNEHPNFTFSKYSDSATAELLKLSWNGKQIRKATLTCYRADNGAQYLTVIMEHVIISNITVSGGPGDLPVENVSLDYGLVEYRYKEQKNSSSH